MKLYNSTIVMKTWDEFKKDLKPVKLPEPYEHIGVRCPSCPDGDMYKDAQFAYASNPLKYRYFCMKCGFQEIV